MSSLKETFFGIKPPSAKPFEFQTRDCVRLNSPDRFPNDLIVAAANRRAVNTIVGGPLE
jgi:hypothetical protein